MNNNSYISSNTQTYPMVSKSKVLQKGLTTIPMEIKKKLSIETGMILIWNPGEDNTINIQVIKEPDVFLKGIYTNLKLDYDDLEEKADILINRELKE